MLLSTAAPPIAINRASDTWALNIFFPTAELLVLNANYSYYTLRSPRSDIPHACFPAAAPFNISTTKKCRARVRHIPPSSCENKKGNTWQKKKQYTTTKISKQTFKRGIYRTAPILPPNRHQSWRNVAPWILNFESSTLNTIECPLFHFPASSLYLEVSMVNFNL